MTTNPQPKWQLLKKLPPDEITAHLEGIVKIIKALAPVKPTLEDLRPHLEPLMKHYYLSHTVVTMVAEIQAQTGLTFTRATYTRAAALWGIPSANMAGRGLGKPSGAKSKFNSGRW